jgi:hypothetical protein
MTETDERTVSVRFTMETERHDREIFQKEGHFVPGMKDVNGFRREWDGPLVFVGTIWQDVRDVQGQVTGRNQVLRVLADSPMELERLMQLAIKDSFFAWWSAQQLQGSTYESYRKHVDEHNQLVADAPGGYMPSNAASMSTADVARAVIGYHQAISEGLRATLAFGSESRTRRLKDLEDALPWWSKMRRSAK